MRLRSALAPFTAAALACAAPAFAQAVESLTVTGHAPGERPQNLSEVVSYADLNLNDPGDRDRLLVRVNNAARRICTRLNEAGPSPANLGHSCQDVAVRGAMDQVRFAIAEAGAGPAYANAAAHGAPVSAMVPDTVVAAYGPVPDTPQNRARYGGPMSRAGRRTGPDGH